MADANLKILQEKLGYQFKDEKNLRLALVHPSWIEEKKKPSFESNERLEFLGDSVLNLAIAEVLYQKFPDIPEGLLSKARANLISRSCMTRLGLSLSLGEYLLLSKGEENTGGRTRASSIGNAMEAIFGAIFLESGFEVASRCVLNLLHDAIEDTPFDHQLDDNPKGELQEFLMRKKLELPVYECVEKKGPSHRPLFVYRVLLKGREMARATGGRRQTAEANCARIVLEKLKTLS
jgi:ribonuclease-3